MPGVIATMLRAAEAPAAASAPIDRAEVFAVGRMKGRMDGWIDGWTRE